MTFLQWCGAVLGGLLFLYIACRLIFTAWFNTRKQFNQPRKGE